MERFRRLRFGTGERESAAPKEEHVTAEGFLCPVCMKTFRAAPDLEDHYLSAHVELPGSGETELIPPTDSNDDSGIGDHHSQTRSDSGDQDVGDDEAKDATNTDATQVHHSGSFTCPQCMQEFENAPTLQSHFEALHQFVDGGRDGDVNSMKHALNDLRASLKEERWFSQQLKKELENLQTQLASREKDPKSVEEADYYLQQIQALEAGKALVASKMLEMEKELSAQKRANEAMNRERDRVIQKSAAMSKEHAAIKAQWDEEMSQKIALGDEVVKLKDLVKTLRTHLDERPSADDVDVLKKELVHAQTAMDSLAREQEDQVAQLRADCENFQSTCREQEEIIQSLMDQMEENKGTESSKQNAPVVDEPLQAQLDEKLAEISRLQEKVDQVNKERTLTSALSETGSESQISTETIKSLQDSMSQAKAEFQQKLAEKEFCVIELKADLNEANCERHTKSLEIENLQEKLKESEENYKKVLELSEKVSQTEADVETKAAELLKLTEDLKVARNECDQKGTQLEALEKQMKELEMKLESQEHEAEAKREMIADLESTVGGHRSQIEQFEVERKNLLKKIEEGEGSNAAIDQLSQDKEGLESALKEQLELNGNLKNELAQLKSEHHRATMELKSEVESEKSGNGKLSSIIKDLEGQTHNLESEKSQLVARVNEMTRVIKDLKSEHRAETDRLSKLLKNKDGNLTESSKLCESLQNQLKTTKESLSAKSESCTKLEGINKDCLAKMKSSEDKIQALLKTVNGKTTELDKAADTKKKLLEELGNTRAQFSGLQSEKKELEAEIAKQQTSLQDYQEQLKNKEHDIKSLKENLAKTSDLLAQKEQDILVLAETKSTQEAAIKQLEDLTAVIMEKYLTQELREAHNATKKELSSRTEVEENLKRELEDTARSCEKMKTSMQMKDQELTQMCGDKERVVGECVTLKANFETLKNEYDSLKLDKENMDTNHLDLQKKLADITAEKIFKEKECIRMSETFESETEQLRKEMKSKDERISEALKDVDALKNLVKQSQDNLKSSENSWAVKNKKLEQKIGTLEASLKTLNEEKQKLHEDQVEKDLEAQRQISSLTDRLSQLRVELTTSKDVFQSKEAELIQSLAESQDLKSQLSLVTEEKRTLMEKCLSMEQSLESEQERADGLRVRYDDAIAAMHELGRENQSLQIDMSKLHHRRWADDKEAVNCNSCGNQFSLKIRKHHCRNCGLIFCNDCSSKLANVPSWKKPVRVCDACHDELASR